MERFQLRSYGFISKVNRRVRRPTIVARTTVGGLRRGPGDHGGSPLPGVLLFVLFVEVSLLAAQDDAAALDVGVRQRV